MIAADISLIDRHLGDLFMSYSRKKLPESTVKLWFRHLREFEVELVCDVLEQWARDNEHLPSLALLRKACKERRSAIEFGKRQNSAPLAPTQHTAASREFFRWWAQFKPARKSIPVAGFVRLGDAINVPVAASPQIESEAQREARLEREAIQFEAA